jgi:hypothetical protein
MLDVFVMKSEFPPVKISCLIEGIEISKEAPCFFNKNGLSVIKYPSYKGSYRVTHVRTGCYIKPTLTNKKVAIQFCRSLLKLYDWEKISSPEQVKRLHDLKKKIVSLRKKMKLTKELP